MLSRAEDDSEVSHTACAMSGYGSLVLKYPVPAIAPHHSNFTGQTSESNRSAHGRKSPWFCTPKITPNFFPGSALPQGRGEFKLLPLTPFLRARFADLRPKNKPFKLKTTNGGHQWEWRERPEGRRQFSPEQKSYFQRMSERSSKWMVANESGTAVARANINTSKTGLKITTPTNAKTPDFSGVFFIPGLYRSRTNRHFQRKTGRLQIRRRRKRRIFRR